MNLIALSHVAALLSAGPLVAVLCLLMKWPTALSLALTAGVGVMLPVAQLLWDKRRTQERLEQTEIFVQRLLDVIPEPVYVKDASGHYVMINEAFALQRGESREQIIGRTAQELAPDLATIARVAQEDAHVLSGQNIYKEESIAHLQTSEIRHRIVTKGSCLNAQGEQVIIGANFDITRLRQTEQQLQKALQKQTSAAQRSREFVQHIIDVIPYPFYIRDAESRYRWVNQALLERFGMSREKVIGATPQELLPDAPQSMLSREEDVQVLAGRNLSKEESGSHPINGNPYHQIVIKGCCADADGEPVIVGVNIDITGLRNSERRLSEMLAEQQQHHQRTLDFVQRVLDLLPYPVYVKDAQSRYLMVNSAMARDAFMTKEDLIEHMGITEASSPKMLRQLFEEDGEVLAGVRVLKEENSKHPHTGREIFRIVAKGTCENALGEPVIVGASIDLTDLRLAEREIIASLERETALRERTEAFVQRLIDVIPDPVYVKKEGHYLLINDAFAEYQGRSKEELLAPSAPFPHASEESRLRSEQEDQDVLSGQEVLFEEHTQRRATGDEVWRVVLKRRSIYIDGSPVVVGVDRHITQWRQAEIETKAALARETLLRRNTQEFVQRLIDLIPDPVYVKKAGGLYVLVNEAFIQYHQRPREEVLQGPNSLPFTRSELRKLSLAEDEVVLSGEEISKEEHTVRQATGEEVYRIVTKRRSTYIDGEPVIVGIDHHITRWRIAERELQRLAREDALTGLSNRRHFREEAERMIARSARYKEDLSLMMLDIDHFKRINDSWGHNIGDEVLKETVKRALAGLRSTDLLARWGGEEFIALLPRSRLDLATQVAERVRETLAASPVASSGGAIPVTLSGGVAQWQAGENIDQLVSRADAALYQAKMNGRNRIQPASRS